MTRVMVNSGICGFITTIEVEKVDKRKVKVVVSSDCEMVSELGESLIELDQWEVMKQQVDCEVYKAASSCQLHVACPVPVGILKAIEVEAGLALPRDIVIHFETSEHD